MPKYYCPFVKNWLEINFKNIKYYNVNPFDTEAQVDFTPFNQHKDLILVNNYWGLKMYNLPKDQRPIIVEDHSHGWLSKGCIKSEADFCIASLRKTLPVPLGGIAWKPKESKSKVSLPQINSKTNNNTQVTMQTAWSKVQLAMNKKSSCISVKHKNEFLTLYSEGEQLLRDTHEILPLKTEHATVVKHFLFKNFNGYKKKNLNYIKSLLTPNTDFKILDNSNHIPFGLLLIFKDSEKLTTLKKFLISKSIYPAELWPENQIGYNYKFLLNIHIDFRYNTTDLNYIAEKLNLWTAPN